MVRNCKEITTARYTTLMATCYFQASSKVIMNAPAKEPTPPPLRRGPCCFNCDGSHQLRECTLPRDHARISEKRKAMNSLRVGYVIYDRIYKQSTGEAYFSNAYHFKTKLQLQKSKHSYLFLFLKGKTVLKHVVQFSSQQTNRHQLYYLAQVYQSLTIRCGIPVMFFFVVPSLLWIEHIRYVSKSCGLVTPF